MIWWLGLAYAGVVADGAAAFSAGQLDEAIEIWSAADEGLASAVVQYNLGTAYYRKGDLPRSVAHLRAAEVLAPRNNDIHHNLALARSELQGVPEAVAPEVRWTQILTPGELGLLGLLGLGLGSGLLLAGRRRRQLVVPGLVSWGLGLGLGAAASWGAQLVESHPVGVVVDEPAVLRDAASLRGEARLELAPGSEVRVSRSYAGFLLVEDGRGRRGWVPDGALLVPLR